MNEAFDEFSPPKRKWVQGWNQGEPSLHGYGEVFPEWSQRDMADFVRRDRNHPSIIMWSIGNEIDYPNDPYTFELMGNSQGQDGGRRFDPDRPSARMMIEYGRPLAAIIRELDPTRAVTMAMANRPVINAIGLPELLDVVGYNYQEVNYEEDHATYPKRVYIGSETRHDFEAWVHVRDKEYISGQFLWTGIDYLGEAGRYPSRAAGSGLLDLAGFVKPRGQFRKALWTDEPMIWAGMGSRRGGGFAGRSGVEGWFGEEGRERDVDVYTNCTEAELFLNGESLGRKTREAKADPTLRWEVPYAAGELKAVAYREGEAAAEYAVRSAGEPARVEARLVPMQPGDTTAQIEIDVMDAEGVRCWRASDRVKLTVEGPGRLLGIENGDTRGSDPYQDAEHPVYGGRALAFVKVGEGSGAVTVKISAEGLEPVEVEIKQ
jgi:beta-galactosidase